MTKTKIRKDAKAMLIKELNLRHSRKKSGKSFTAKDIKVNTRFKEDLGLDSLDMVELLMVFEEELFGGELYLDESLFTKMPTFGEVEDVLLKFYEDNKDDPKLFGPSKGGKK
jgi:acyl carrier protein